MCQLMDVIIQINSDNKEDGFFLMINIIRCLIFQCFLLSNIIQSVEDFEFIINIVLSS